MLHTKNLSVSIDQKKIIEGVDWSIEPGELHIIVGPNGAGKSTFLHAIAGLPHCEVEGEIILDRTVINELSHGERFHKGILLTYQNPPEIEGLSIIQFLTTILKEKAKREGGKEPSTTEVLQQVQEYIAMLDLPQDFYARMVHSGLSGGQKKLLELLQVLLIKPSYVLFDEIDSGLDIAKQKVLIEVVKNLAAHRIGVVYVTHSLSVAEQFQKATVMMIRAGRIEKQGDQELIREIKKHGYTG